MRKITARVVTSPDQVITCYADDTNILVGNKELSEITDSGTKSGDRLIQ